jgi:nitrogen fixation protein NifU and related proteins
VRGLWYPQEVGAVERKRCELMQGLSHFGQDVRADLQDLYQEVIVDHSKNPRFKGKPLGGCQICQDGKNPSCGDELTVFCKVHSAENAQTEASISLRFSGKGCAISQASASMMCELIQNKQIAACRDVLHRAESTYTGSLKIGADDDLEADLDALFGVSKFPVRVKCAALPWKTLEMILNEHFDGAGAFLGDMNAVACESTRAYEYKSLKVVLDD